jgi:4a-hydroxytetrahydrobiopterin dehydratase
MNFSQKKCVPCEGGAKPLPSKTVREYLTETPNWRTDWRNRKLYKQFVFKNFLEAMSFLNQVADVAESEGHHPDFTVHYNKVDFVIWTHAVGGLSENDFILAAKIDALKKI